MAKQTKSRLTGLFKTKTRGLYTGTIKDQWLDGLIDTIRKAKKADRGVVFFLWKSDDEESKAAFNLNADVANEYEPKKAKYAPKRKPIEPDDDEDERGLRSWNRCLPLLSKTQIAL